MNAAINIPSEQLADFCERHQIQQLALFGSVLRDDFRPDSDVDILVEFAPGKAPDFFRLYDIEQELSALLGGYSVDLVTFSALNHRLRDSVLSRAEVKYEKN